MLKGKCNEMNIQREIQDKIQQLLEYGTSEGVQKSWEVRKRSRQGKKSSLIKQQHLQKYANIVSRKLGLPRTTISYTPKYIFGGDATGYYSPSTSGIDISRHSGYKLGTLHHELAHHYAFIKKSKLDFSKSKTSHTTHGRRFQLGLKKISRLRKRGRAIRKYKYSETD